MHSLLGYVFLQDWLPGKEPGWWKAVSGSGEVLADFLNDPGGFIQKYVVKVIAEIVLTIGETAISAIQTLFDVTMVIPQTLGDVLGDVFVPIGGAIMRLIISFNEGLMAFAEGLGWWGPYVVVPLVLLVALLMTRFVVDAAATYLGIGVLQP